MELQRTIDKRKSIRAFKDKAISDETIRRLLKTANKAPSAGNLQARDFVVVKDEEKKKKLSKASSNQFFMAEAPSIIVICANKKRSADRYGERGMELYSIIDASLAAQNLMLSAVEEGLGCVYIGAFNEEEVSRAINAPDEVKPVGLIPLGYPDEEPGNTSRVKIDEIVHNGSF